MLIFTNAHDFEAWMESRTADAISTSHWYANQKMLAHAKAWDDFATDLAQARVWLANDDFQYSVKKFREKCGNLTIKIEAYNGSINPVMDLDVTLRY